MSKDRKRTAIYTTHAIDRDKFETILEKHSKTFHDIKTLHKNGALKLNPRLYTLEDVIEISYAAFRAGWTMVQMYEEPKAQWVSDKGKALADKIIKDAFR